MSKKSAYLEKKVNTDWIAKKLFTSMNYDCLF